jgi:hypothetical protein
MLTDMLRGHTNKEHGGRASSSFLLLEFFLSKIEIIQNPLIIISSHLDPILVSVACQAFSYIVFLLCRVRHANYLHSQPQQAGEVCQSDRGCLQGMRVPHDILILMDPHLIGSPWAGSGSGSFIKSIWRYEPYFVPLLSVLRIRDPVSF